MKKVFSIALATALLTGCNLYKKNGEDGANAHETSNSTYASHMTTSHELPSTVYFDFARDTLTSSAHQVLDAHAQFLAANPHTNVIIAGHTDAKGPQSYNLGLSQRRARAIATYLVSKGVSQHQLTEVSFGKEHLISTQDDLNRRVEITYQS
jgi:peptidoglycan-associated lipoprotein